MSRKTRVLNAILAVCLVIAMAAPAVSVMAAAPTTSNKLYMVPNSHIDTSWGWTFEHVGRHVINQTFDRALNALRQNTTYKFAASASKHYEWAREYHPALYYGTGSYANNGIKQMVARGQWEITGGQVVEPDLNCIDGESFARQSLYAQHFFAEEFPGYQPTVGFVPDVFGFSGQFPQVIKKSEMNYFVSSKMNWNDANKTALNEGPFFANRSDRESDIFWWRGIDGTDVLSYALQHNYTGGGYESSVTSSNGNIWDRNNMNVTISGVQYDYRSNIPIALGLYGEGDHGGGPSYAAPNTNNDNTYGWPSYLNTRTQASVVVGTCGEFFNDLETNWKPQLDRKHFIHEGEIYLMYHRGVYTSWSRAKKYNRQNEILTANAEKAATLAYWTGGAETNSADKLAIAWDKILVNQMHDILPGTSTPFVYYTMFNNHELAKNLATNVRDSALLALAYQADTRVGGDGVPVFVYNPSAWERSNRTTVKLTLDGAFESVKIFDGANELPVTAEALGNGVFEIEFMAKNVPALGYKVYKAVGAAAATAVKTFPSLSAPAGGDWVLENENLKVTISKDTGNIKSLINKAAGNREMFRQGADCEGNELQVQYDPGANGWSAWDVGYEEIGRPDAVMTRLINDPKISVITDDAEKVTVLVARTWEGSTFAQYITLASGSDRVDVHFEVDWAGNNQILKLAFPIDVDATRADYEIAFGAYNRSTLRDTVWNLRRFEQSGHKWMDVTSDNAVSGTKYGVSILNDAKYGYDVLRFTSNGTVANGQGRIPAGGGTDPYVRARISVLRSASSHGYDTRDTTQLERDLHRPYSHTMDQGFQEFNYAIYPHTGDFRDANTPVKATEFCHPMTAFQTVEGQGDGVLGAAHSFVSTGNSDVIVTAVKNQYDDDVKAVKTPDDKNKFIVRLYEPKGRDNVPVTLTMPADIKSAKEVNLLEHVDPQFNKTVQISGRQVSFTVNKYEILTLEITLDPYARLPVPLDQKPISLASAYNVRATSPDGSWTAGNMDAKGNTVPQELWPSSIDYQGIKFTMGPAAANNYVMPAGQTVALPADASYNRIYVVGAAADANNASADFKVNYAEGGSVTATLKFAHWNTDLSGWNRFARMDDKPYVLDAVAHLFTHFHDGVQNRCTNDNYLFIYAIDVNPAMTLDSLELPDAPGIRIAAVSAAFSPIPGFAKIVDSKEPVLPDSPTNVSATEVAEHDILITWDAPEGPVPGNYMVYCGSDADFAISNTALLKVIPGMTPSYVYRPLTRGTFYFKVVAISKELYQSAPSEVSNECEGGYINYSLSAVRVWAPAGGYSNETPEKAADGNPETKWCVGGVTPTSGRGYLFEQLVADDAEPVVIEKFKVSHAGTQETAGYNTKSFVIESSLDGVTYLPVPGTDVTNNTASITEFKLAQPIATRYVRLFVRLPEQSSNGTNDQQTVRIFEFYALGLLPYDNMPKPAAPTNVQAANWGNATTNKWDSIRVTWDASASPPDISGYSVFAYPTPDFEISQAFPVGTTNASTRTIDFEPDGRAAFFFKVVAISVNGIPSEPSASTTTGVMGGLINLCVSNRTDVRALINSSFPNGGYNNEEPIKAVDGLYNTKWCRGDINNTANSGYLIVDFDGSYQIRFFRLVHAGELEGTFSNTRDYRIDGVRAGEAKPADFAARSTATGNAGWRQMVTDVNNNTANVTENNLTTAAQAFSYSQVRLNVTHADQGGGGNVARIYEFQAFGMATNIPKSPVSTANQRLAFSPLDPVSSMKLTATYEFVTNNKYVVEYGSTFVWEGRLNGSSTWTAISGAPNSKEFIIPYNVLEQYQTVRCTVTPKSNEDVTGTTFTVEWAYKTSGRNTLLNTALTGATPGWMPNEGPELLVNGIMSDKWCKRYVSSTGPASNSWQPEGPMFASFDLAGIYKIDTFRVYHSRSGITGGSDYQVTYNTPAFEIHYSLDGIKWYTAVNVTNNTADSTTHPVGSQYVYARYLKLVINEADSCPDSGTSATSKAGNMGAARIREFVAEGTFVCFDRPLETGRLEKPVFITDHNGGLGFKVVDPLATAAGKTVVAGVYDTFGAGEEVVLIAALYKEGRLVSYIQADPATITSASAPTQLSTALPIPADTANLTYKLFIWDGKTLVPLTAPTILE